MFHCQIYWRCRALKTSSECLEVASTHDAADDQIDLLYFYYHSHLVLLCFSKNANNVNTALTLPPPTLRPSFSFCISNGDDDPNNSLSQPPNHANVISNTWRSHRFTPSLVHVTNKDAASPATTLSTLISVDLNNVSLCARIVIVGGCDTNTKETELD